MKQRTRGILSAGLFLAMSLSLTGCQQPATDTTETPSAEPSPSQQVQVETYSDMPLKTVDADPSDADYYEKALETEIYNFKVIRNVPTAYEAEGWDAYCSVANTLLTIDPTNISEVFQNMIDNSITAREALVQIAPAADCMWYIWGEDMATAEEINPEDFTVNSYDNADAKPYLVPYLVEDQSTAKGNMIVIAGGGYSSRGNAMEGYPIAEGFRDLGYNAYVLQRRVEPYSSEDVWLDMQRSVRYLRYNAETLGLGGMDCIAASGFSGGSGTILGAVAYLYGDVQPTYFDKDYVPDEVDGVNSDLDVVCPLYGPQYGYASSGGSLSSDYQGLVTDNPNIPDMFLAVGEDDATGARDDIFILAESVRGKALVEVHTFATVGHGFGPGLEGTTSTYWIPMADTFIDLVMDRNSEKGNSAVEIPEGYTKFQQYSFEGGFGQTDVTCAVNDDMSKFYIVFTAFDEEQILEGVLENGVVTVTYDKTGFMSGDAQAIYNAVDQNGWQDISALSGSGAAAEIPDGYTKKQVYQFEGGFGKADVTCAVNDDMTKFYIAFTAFDEEQILEGVLEDGVVTVTYDKTGFMTGDAQAIYNAANQGAWESIE